MQPELQFHFPDWPPRRLTFEAVLAWNLRHLDQPQLDLQGSEWPLLRGAILNLLRHQLSAYDSRLRDRCEHDAAFRDELVQQIERAAYRQYRWLAADPRPFPPASEEVTLFLDSVAAQLADLRSLHHQTTSALADLRRTGGPNEHLDALQRGAQDIEKQMQDLYKFLTHPKSGVDDDGSKWIHSFVVSREWEGREWGYYFFSARPLPPNRIDYIGVRCPRCDASVARRKRLINLGQHYSRVGVWSCHCISYIVCQPYGTFPSPVTQDEWAKMVRASQERWEKFVARETEKQEAEKAGTLRRYRVAI
jgi:hypothetical protein